MVSDISSLAAGVDRAFFFILWVSVVLLAVITVVMVVFVIKYSRKKNKTPKDIEGNTVLEVIWIVVPTLLVLGMFYYGWVGFELLRNIPEDAMMIKVEARMWSWSFEYANGKKSDKLRIPVGRNVKLQMNSKDVVHSLYIPAFRVKEDLVPRQETYMWFVSNRVGTYDLFCTEYCGHGHSKMSSKVIVMPEKDFELWYKTAEGEKWVPLDGELLVEKNGCLECHSTDGSPMLGPTFKGIFGKKRVVLTKGREIETVADEEYLRNSLLEPDRDLVKGFQATMPSLEGGLTANEIETIITYLKGVK